MIFVSFDRMDFCNIIKFQTIQVEMLAGIAIIDFFWTRPVLRLRKKIFGSGQSGMDDGKIFSGPDWKASFRAEPGKIYF